MNSKSVSFSIMAMHSFLIFHLLFLLFSFTSPVAPDFNSKYCSTPEPDSYTNTSSFSFLFLSDLKQLLVSLPQNAVKNEGFFNDTIGEAYGLAMCHYNVLIENCRSCLEEAAGSAIHMCPNSTTAALFYDQCFIRYSNQNFFSVASTDSLSPLVSSRKESAQLSQFLIVVEELMNKLITNVVSSRRLAVEGNANYTAVDIVYGLVECTRDLPVPQCQNCLSVGFKGIRYDCDGSIGCRLYGPSCYLQYEVGPLYDPFPPPPSPPPRSPPPLPPQLAPPSVEPSKGFRKKKKRVTTYASIVVASSIVLLLALTSACFWIRRQRKTIARSRVDSKEHFQHGTELVQFDFETLRDATSNFSDENKLGEGGFGPVFKGRLQNGQEIAVKRLSTNSKQGIAELKNEVELLGRLKHRNLVQVLGCCMENDEKLLCYEYLPNGSLDAILFAKNSSRRAELDWRTRFKIVEGISRGLVYLHVESGATIIHRDLKAGNILLNMSMNPKISDFGIARLFCEDQTHKTTFQIVGTRGYISPEYFMSSIFSAKSDVYSFGVLVLEIVTGRRCGENFISYVWRHYQNCEVLELKDPALPDTCLDQVKICIHIGLLCVEENPEHRPSMSEVNLMLSSQSASMLPALQPRGLQLPLISEDNTDSDSTKYILDKVNHDHSSTVE